MSVTFDYNVAQLTFDSTQTNSQLELQSLSQPTIEQSLTATDQKFLLDNAANYKKTKDAIQELVDHKVLVTPVPIKLQTMLEKKLLVKNFDECVEAYNRVMTDPNSLIKGLGLPYDPEDIDNIVTNEIGQWHTLPRLT
jgi:hypothetical protein